MNERMDRTVTGLSRPSPLAGVPASSLDHFPGPRWSFGLKNPFPPVPGSLEAGREGFS